MLADQTSRALLVLGACILAGSVFIYHGLSKIAEQAPSVNTAASGNAIRELPAKSEEPNGNIGQQKQLLTFGETMVYLGITERGLQALMEKTDIPYITINNSHLFPKPALDEWLKHTGSNLTITFEP
ncbi:helix-turn-helix domain-containing protein [Brevibacillus sp. SYP-B805]|uniref:helix-turn-helix domain-containing protein n=1 Tax=Brevibacillus sp. SYP-B805 TaxID=1578199 RepID=UPI0013EC98D7|nr:helix-turn-helix domain-containing protein [Brevibacillus sp. SYP-B805]NGQ93833.1 helix-turn-helix domain-containing protein [Brevibacillus sp. SYP-B805]